MTGRAYMEEVLTQVWLKSKLASYLTSECTKREFVKILPGFMQASPGLVSPADEKTISIYCWAPASSQKSVGKTGA